MSQFPGRLPLVAGLLTLIACTGDSSRSPVASTGSSVLVPPAASTRVVAPAAGGLRASNVPPRLVLKATPALDTSTSPATLRGTAPFTVRLNLCGSDDADAGDSLNWQFHFGDSGSAPFGSDGVFKPDFEHQCRAEHTYREGEFTATVSVTDKHLEDQARGQVGVLARTTTQVRIVASALPEAPAPSTVLECSTINLPLPPPPIPLPCPMGAAPQYCVAAPIDATSADHARAACEACNGVGACVLVGGCVGPAWKRSGGGPGAAEFLFSSTIPGYMAPGDINHVDPDGPGPQPVCGSNTRWAP